MHTNGEPMPEGKYSMDSPPEVDSDNFMTLWFRFVYPHHNRILETDADTAMDDSLMFYCVKSVNRTCVFSEETIHSSSLKVQ